MEDEPAILKATTKVLEAWGYAVLSANSPTEATRLAREPRELHLLLTDMIMPQMNGRDLAAALSLLHPKLKVLFMSGFTADVMASHGVVDEGAGFLQKPFSTTELAARVRAALDS